MNLNKRHSAHRVATLVRRVALGLAMVFLTAWVHVVAGEGVARASGAEGEGGIAAYGDVRMQRLKAWGARRGIDVASGAQGAALLDAMGLGHRNSAFLPSVTTGESTKPRAALIFRDSASLASVHFELWKVLQWMGDEQDVKSGKAPPDGGRRDLAGFALRRMLEKGSKADPQNWKDRLEARRSAYGGKDGEAVHKAVGGSMTAGEEAELARAGVRSAADEQAAHSQAAHLWGAVGWSVGMAVVLNLASTALSQKMIQDWKMSPESVHLTMLGGMFMVNLLQDCLLGGSIRVGIVGFGLNVGATMLGNYLGRGDNDPNWWISETNMDRKWAIGTGLNFIVDIIFLSIVMSNPITAIGFAILNVAISTLFYINGKKHDAMDRMWRATMRGQMALEDYQRYEGVGGWFSWVGDGMPGSSWDW